MFHAAQQISQQYLSFQMGAWTSKTWWLVGEIFISDKNILLGCTFKTCFTSCALIDSVVDARNQCYIVIHNKVPSHKEIYWMEILLKMKFLLPWTQWKTKNPLILMAFPVNFLKECGKLWVKTCIKWIRKISLMRICLSEFLKQCLIKFILENATRDLRYACILDRAHCISG